MRPAFTCILIAVASTCPAQSGTPALTPDTREAIREEVARLTPERVRYLEELVAKGNLRAKLVLSTALKHGEVIASDPVRSLRLLTEAARFGYAPAQNELGSYYMLANHVEKNIQTARVWFEKSSTQGYPDADFNLGLLAGRGEGGAVDWPLAVRHFRVAARQGHATAAYILGMTLREGKNVAQDLKEGVKWLEVAAHHGEAKAQLELGVAYFNGQGVAKDTKAAFTWLLRAADQGLPEAQMNVALIYHRGEAGPADVEQALFWYRRAAAGHHPAAMRVLGALYADGSKVQQNKVAAAAYLIAAIEAGDGASAEFLTELKRDITPEQYAEAIAMSRDYLIQIGMPKRDVVATK